ncbi:MAG: hydroxymethylbilane synthase [Candidatus Binataceae bacterium]
MDSILTATTARTTYDRRAGERMIQVMLRIASRPSALALAQANLVKARLEARLRHPVEIVPISTRGDKLTSASLARIGGKGLFIHELEQVLIEGRADVAVHSMKDLPAALSPAFRIIAVPEREDARDALISRGSGGFAMLPPGARLGTSSIRRRLQALRRRPDLEVVALRGNVDTRLTRLQQSNFDAIMLALAGLKRLDRSNPGRGLANSLAPRGLNLEALNESDFVPSGGQGALAIETLADLPLCGSTELEVALASLNDRRAAAETTAERTFLETIGASCVSPVGVRATAEQDVLSLRAMLFNQDGSRNLTDERSVSCDANSALDLSAAGRRLGLELGHRMLDLGARELIGE